MRGLRLRLAAAVSATLLVLSGCGIPDNSDVMPVGPGPSEGPSLSEGGTGRTPLARDAATDRSEFVDYYLQAAAGDPEGSVNRVKDFLAADVRAQFKPTEVKVVRLLVRPLVNSGSPDISLTVQQVGTLGDNGVLNPTPDLAPAKYTLTVGSVTGQSGFFVTKAPTVMLLSDTALHDYYQQHTIYFWNNENSGLVPDVRYMPLSLIAEQQPTTILNWLVAGPSRWIQDGVRTLPQSTTLPDNIPAISDDKLQINLSAQAVPANDPNALERMRRQLQWSLGGLTPRTLELTIGHEQPVSYSDIDYKNSNAAYGRADVPERFVISNGQIRRLADWPHADEAVPVLKPEANRDVRLAALTVAGSHTFAAVVTVNGATQALRVGVTAQPGAVTDLKQVKLPAGTLGRPVWAITTAGDTDTATGLVTVSGKLYSFTSGGQPAQPVEWPNTAGAVTSVSVAPDGHRVALVAGGRLYRTVISGGGGDGVAFGDVEPLRPPTMRTVAAVAWTSEGWLMVAGIRPDNRYTIVDVTVDGALSEPRLEDIGTDAVTDVVAYPANPLSSQQLASSESFVADGAAFDALGLPVRITAADLAGAKVGDPKNSDPKNTPTAPFFLD
ncbi:LpqB family beta-propeller domain-containing protein [Micromonosporaceae bacterium Da 78-11]